MWSIRSPTVKEPIVTPLAERHTYAICPPIAHNEVGVVLPTAAPIALGPTHAPHGHRRSEWRVVWEHGADMAARQIATDARHV